MNKALFVLAMALTIGVWEVVVRGLYENAFQTQFGQANVIGDVGMYALGFLIVFITAYTLAHIFRLGLKK